MPGIFSYCHTPINLLSNFDVELQQFLKKVIVVEKKETESEQLNEALRIVTRSEFPSIQQSYFDNSLHRMLYMFRFSPCYTSAVANHFLRLVNRNPMILRDAMWRRQVKICCLGGGPGTEVVALSKILSSAQDCFWQATKKRLHLQVTIIDKNRHWTETSIKVRQTLVDSAEMFDKAKMEISFRFLVADLTETLDNDVREALQTADIVTVVNLLSALSEMKLKTRSLLMKKFAERMKPDGVLFFLDTKVTKLCHILHKTFQNLSNIAGIYGPKELEVFTLTLQSLQKNVEFFWEKFHENICLTGTIVNSCAWIKTDGLEKHPSLISYTEIQKKFPLTANQRKIQWQNKALVSQEKLRVFYKKKVTKMFPREGQSFEDFSLDFSYEYPEDFSLDFSYEYPLVSKTVLFCNKSKNRRLFITTDVRV